jgi:hypothetical protein
MKVALERLKKKFRFLQISFMFFELETQIEIAKR